MPIEIIITAPNEYNIDPGQGCVETAVALDLIDKGLAYEVEPTPLPAPRELEPIRVIHEYTPKAGRPKKQS